MEFIKNNWIKIPVVLYVMGFAVHNVYLADYHSFDFELVQTKYIFSGFAFLTYSAILFIVVSLKINPSDISSSFQVDKLAPWLLRIFCFPYIIYNFLYDDSFFRSDLENLNGFNFTLFQLKNVATLLFIIMIIDLVMLWSMGSSRNARLYRSLIRILSVPIIVFSLFVAWINPLFSGLLQSATFFFFGFVGLAMRQSDNKLGIDTPLLDDATKDEHEITYSIFFGIIAILFVFGIALVNYTKYIYPYLPSAYGGAKLEDSIIYLKEQKINETIIQESNIWVLYIDESTGKTTKIKQSSIEKIEYE